MVSYSGGSPIQSKTTPTYRATKLPSKDAPFGSQDAGTWKNSKPEIVKDGLKEGNKSIFNTDLGKREYAAAKKTLRGLDGTATGVFFSRLETTDKTQILQEKFARTAAVIYKCDLLDDNTKTVSKTQRKAAKKEAEQGEEIDQYAQELAKLLWEEYNTKPEVQEAVDNALSPFALARYKFLIHLYHNYRKQAMDTTDRVFKTQTEKLLESARKSESTDHLVEQSKQLMQESVTSQLTPSRQHSLSKLLNSTYSDFVPSMQAALQANPPGTPDLPKPRFTPSEASYANTHVSEMTLDYAKQYLAEDPQPEDFASVLPINTTRALTTEDIVRALEPAAICRGGYEVTDAPTRASRELLIWTAKKLCKNPETYTILTQTVPLGSEKRADEVMRLLDRIAHNNFEIDSEIINLTVPEAEPVARCGFLDEDALIRGLKSIEAEYFHPQSEDEMVDWLDRKMPSYEAHIDYQMSRSILLDREHWEEVVQFLVSGPTADRIKTEVGEDKFVEFIKPNFLKYKPKPVKPVKPNLTSMSSGEHTNSTDSRVMVTVNPKQQVTPISAEEELQRKASTKIRNRALSFRSRPLREKQPKVQQTHEVATRNEAAEKDSHELERLKGKLEVPAAFLYRDQALKRTNPKTLCLGILQSLQFAKTSRTEPNIPNIVSEALILASRDLGINREDFEQPSCWKWCARQFLSNPELINTLTSTPGLTHHEEIFDELKALAATNIKTTRKFVSDEPLPLDKKLTKEQKEFKKGYELLLAQLRELCDQREIEAKTSTGVKVLNPGSDDIHTIGRERIHKMWLDLRDCWSNPSRQELTKGELRKHNRYKNIAPYDDNLVFIHDPEQGDIYRNASPLSKDGLGNKPSHIATDGPIATSVRNQARLIAQEKVPAIIVVSNAFELGKEKFKQYWGDEIGDEVDCGHYVIRTTKRTDHKVTEAWKSDHPMIFARECEVELHEVLERDPRQRTPTKIGKVTTHSIVQFLGWPDHGAPESGKTFLNFVEIAEKATQKHTPPPKNFKKGKVDDRDGSGPVMVHCSAGCGRTGTFITPDHIVRILKDPKESRENKQDAINHAIRTLRSQREQMVQAEAQLQFLIENLDSYIRKELEPKTK